MNSNVITVLLCLAFAGIGFLLGRTTGHHGVHHGGRHQGHCEMHASCGTTSKSICSGQHGLAKDIEVMIADAGDFEGDTVLAIPGGEVMIHRSGEEVQVQVEMDEKGDGNRVIERRIVIQKEEDR